MIGIGQRLVWLVTAAAAAVTAGCGEPTATVSGVVLLDGAPLAMSDDMRGTVVFQPVNQEGPTLNGIINATGCYELATGANKLVRPGEYTATVSAVEILSAGKDRPLPTGRRMTPDKYATAADSGLNIVVAPGPNSIKLNLTSDAGAEGDSSGDVPAPTDERNELN